MSVAIIVQARVGSTRFPQKILQNILGKPLLLRQLERISQAKSFDQLIVATTNNTSDDIIEEICVNEGYEVFRGSESDLLDRHYQAGLKYKADNLVKIPSDCPLIDPNIIDTVVNYFLDNQDKYDFVSNLHPATYPDGNDVEIMSMSALEVAWKEAKKDYEREHTTPFIWDNPSRFRIGNVELESGLNYSMDYRFTIDYIEDYQFIKVVYDELYPLNPKFSLYDILDLLNKKPEIKEINSKYNGVNWYRNYLNQLKTVAQTETKLI
ncbi:MAG: glycosyltransferase family protein [Chloroherpetonaceae bacterium]